MRNIKIPYGHGRLELGVEDYRLRGVLKPNHFDRGLSFEEQQALVIEAMNDPIASPKLSEMARTSSRVLVIVSDHTRPVPSRVSLPIILDEIRRGNPDAEIVILIATGMHRPSTEEELREKLGDEIYERERVENHVSTDVDNMVFKGILPSGGRLMLNKRVEWADLVVAEGFIEPHFFAGFSGGRKSILPGIASDESVRYNHNAQFISDPGARQGILDGNPIHRDMAFAAEAAGLKFILNVIIDAEKRVISAFAGDPVAAHRAGCEKCLELTRVDAVCADIVVTSNGGYPLDQNIYQSVKGMTAAESCVNEGGCIVMCAECSDGSGGERFCRFLSEAESPRALLQELADVPPEQTKPDQWQSQILARVLKRANVVFVTRKENRGIIESMHMRWAADIDEAMAVAQSLTSRDAGITVIPDGVGVIVK